MTNLQTTLVALESNANEHVSSQNFLIYRAHEKLIVTNLITLSHSIHVQ